MAAQFRTDMTNESIRNLKDITQYEVDGGLVKSGGEREAKCVVCEGLHQLNDCSVFKTKTIRQRNIVVRTHRLFLNCLNVGHFAFHCKSRLRCLSCRKKTSLAVAQGRCSGHGNSSWTEDENRNQQPSR
jgi:hypothetical protein